MAAGTTFAKLFLLLLALSYLEAKSSEVKFRDKDIMHYFNKCMKDLGIKGPENMMDLFEKKPELSSTSKCFVKCIAEKMSIFSNNALVEENILKWIEVSKQQNETIANVELKMYEACKGISETSECDTAAKMFQCSQKVGIENGILM